MGVTDAVEKALSHTKRKAKFQLGQIVATPGAIELVRRKNLALNTFILRHVTGDWGDIGAEDKATNDEAVEHGYQIHSAYNVGPGRIWIITEWDRSVTTILLPEDY